MRVSAILILLFALVGCANGDIVTPEVIYNPIPKFKQNAAHSDPHMLWGEYTFFFNESHNAIDVVPKRAGRFHLNATKFLEEYCTDCLKIIDIQNNGDGTIDLTVQITHPFKGHPEFTGFDVKGIIMFDASYHLDWKSFSQFPYWDQAKISWKLLGDPEVLNPDGYTPRWCPEWEEGPEYPIYRYWPGKFSKNIPTANINAFLNFYTDEERHMFKHDGVISRTYKIWLPPGAHSAGYAIEACWVQPDIIPVTDPVNDFPISANQPEPYHFRYVINNNDIITDPICCGAEIDNDCSTLWAEAIYWEQAEDPYIYIYAQFPLNNDDPPFGTKTCVLGSDPNLPCLSGTAPNDLWLDPGALGPENCFLNGNYRGLVSIFRAPIGGVEWTSADVAYWVADFELDLP